MKKIEDNKCLYTKNKLYTYTCYLGIYNHIMLYVPISLLLAASERFDILPYEEMALYYPQANQKRPLILVGPPSIGRHELRLRLLEDTSRFAAAVPRKYSIT